MKKRYTIIGIIMVLVVVLSIWLLIHPKALGNINLTYSEPETNISSISFSGEVGDKIKFLLTSKIKKGDLDFIVYDSKGNVVKELDRAKRLETFLILDNSDIYTLKAEYKNFIGSGKIRIYKVD